MYEDEIMEPVETTEIEEVETPVYEDETLVCKECGNEFVFTAGDQAFYAEKGFLNKPKACRACRSARKNAAKPERPTFEAICSDCGGVAKLPFQPSTDRPVYCSACFEARRGNR